ncbi:2TM domain-containing protein [Novosphingobium beihaiensis]|nr:2TM domain-containing protein [Novosphingobium beihaiensis]
MIVQQMRLKHGWSQQELADLSGLNVRTIQRIERGQQASLESFKALGAAFDVDFSELQEQAVRDIAKTPEQIEVALAFSHVRDVKRFFYSVTIYLLVIGALAVFNLTYNPRHLFVLYPAAIWGLVLVWKALRVFDIIRWFGPEWEKQAVERRLGRRL